MKPPIVAELKQKRQQQQQQQQTPMPTSPTLILLLLLLLLLLSSSLVQPIQGLSVAIGNLTDTRSSQPLLPSATTATSSTSAATPSIHGSSVAINRCREGCLAQYSITVKVCSQTRDCSMCWSHCPGAIHGEQEKMVPGCLLQLTVQRLVRNESLVLAEISWNRTACGGAPGPGPAPGPADQCLVTWEVSGGGLMGNLLTEATSNAQLSLWTDTNYRVQVTCRDKHTSSLVRSAPLELNTSAAAMAVVPRPFDAEEHTKPWLTEVAEGDDDGGPHRRLHHPSASPSSPSLFAMPGPGSCRELILLAVFVALLLFLLILLASVLVVRWRPGRDRDRDRTTGRSGGGDRDALVENELLGDILHV